MRLPCTALDQTPRVPPKSGVFRFIIPFTRGIIREQNVRRSAMFFVMLCALVMLFLGATFLDGWLREHPVLFVLYWFACAWATLTAVLLALYDMLAIRAASLRERRRLAAEILAKKEGTHEDPH